MMMMMMPMMDDDDDVCELAHTSYWTCQHRVVVDFHIIYSNLGAKRHR